LDVVVVPEPVEVVAVLLELELVGLVVVELVLVLVVGLLVVVGDDVVEEEELEVELVLELWQSRAARSRTVAAPWPRFWISVLLTVGGSATIAFPNDREALAAAPH
jgi:hypothetical protein